MNKILSKMSISKIAVISSAIMLLVVVLIPAVAHGATLPGPTIPVDSGGGPITLREIEDLIRTAAQFLIVVSIIIATGFIIWGGIRWMMAGGDEEAKDAKTTIKNGIYGAAIVLGVGVILQTVAAIVTRQFFK